MSSGHPKELYSKNNFDDLNEKDIFENLKSF